jgi:hypothetical protein
MKTLLIKSTGVLCCAVLFSFAIADKSITVQQAQAEKKVEVVILPYRTYTGEGIRIEVKNISGKSLNLILPKGSIFIPDNSGEQTLVKSDDVQFALNAGETKPLQFKGYCTELHDGGSGQGATFQIGTTQNEKLKSLLSFMDSLGIRDKSTIQFAVWSITDDNPVSYISTADSASRTLRRYLCNITGQTAPWYNNTADIVETPQRVFEIISREISGEISFRATGRVEMQGTVQDSTGKVVFTNPNKLNAPGGNITFWYRLRVEGWEKGKYYVVYTNNGAEIIRKEFEI